MKNTQKSKEPTLGDQLKDLLKLMRNEPKKFLKHRACELQTVKNYCPDLFIPKLVHAEHSLENTRLAIRGLLASCYINARENAEYDLEFGVLIAYQMIFGDISTSRSFPTLKTILVICRRDDQEDHEWTEFIEDLLDTRRGSKEVYETWVKEDVRGKLFTAESDSNNQTHRNNLQKVLEKLAKEIAQKAPEVFDVFHESAIGISISGPNKDESLLDILQEYAISQCDSMPIKDFIKRHYGTSLLQGELTNNIITSSADSLTNETTLLVGYPCSGRTTCLCQKEYEIVHIKNDSGPRQWVFLCDAFDYLPLARNRRPIYELIGQELARWTGSTNTPVGFLENLRLIDEQGRLLLLIDRLDCMAEVDRADIVEMLYSSPNVILPVLPWQEQEVFDIRRIFSKPDSVIVKCDLEDLELDDQQGLLSVLANKIGDIDMALASRMLHELPDLARLPLGVLAIYDQVRLNKTSSSKILKSVLNEWFIRAGIGEPNWKNRKELGDPFDDVMLVFGRISSGLYTSRNSNDPNYPEKDYMWIDLGWCEGVENFSLDSVMKSRLFEPGKDINGQDAIRLVNRDIGMFLAAYKSLLGYPQRSINKLPVQMKNGSSLKDKFYYFLDGLWGEDD
jgi:hypothetical protein